MYSNPEVKEYLQSYIPDASPKTHDSRVHSYSNSKGPQSGAAAPETTRRE